jgi:hypothetical protein
MPRRTTKTAVIDPNSVNIAEFCASQGINEQIFRLELMQYQEDADSSKVCDFDVARTVADQLAATSKALPETTEIAETITPQELQPAPETATEQPQKPQNSHIVASAPSSPIAQGQAPKTNLPSALEELIKSAEETIELADLVQVYRNQQILSNADARDSELVVKLRERRIETRQATFDRIRELNQKQPEAAELPELPAALSEEIAALSNELGKKLVVG